MEANRDRSKDGKDSKEREENRSERLSSLSLARLCLLSSCNESRCPPHRRKLMIEINCISPKAKIIADRQLVSLARPHAGQAKAKDRNQSYLAKGEIIADRQINPITCPHAGQAPTFTVR